MKKISICLLICMLMVLTGCDGKSEIDPSRAEIIKISITPQPTPTPSLSEIAPDAVVTEGSLTMVNEFLANSANASMEEAESGTEGADGSEE